MPIVTRKVKRQTSQLPPSLRAQPKGNEVLSCHDIFKIYITIKGKVSCHCEYAMVINTAMN